MLRLGRMRMRPTGISATFRLKGRMHAGYGRAQPAEHALIHIKRDGLLNEWQGPAGWELRVRGGTLPAGRLRSPPAPCAPHASTITAVSRLTTGSTSSRTGKAIA